MPPSTIPQLSHIEFANRIAALFPADWASEDAKQPGGVLYAVFAMIAGELTDIMGVPQSQKIAIGGTMTAGDTIYLYFTNPNLAVSPHRVSYTVVAGDTPTAVAQGLAFAVSSDPALSPLGFLATAHTPTIEIKYPTSPPRAIWTTASPPSNATVIVPGVGGSATETVTVAVVAYDGPGALQYADYATRIQTAIGDALDLASLDFLPTIPRLPGEIDAAYRARIIAALLPSGATRTAISRAVQRVTGVRPRLVEPWNPGDTGVTGGVLTASLDWDAPSLVWDDPALSWDHGAALVGAIYSGVDTEATPGRSTNAGPAYQGFCDAVLPTVPLLGGNPVPCSDDGMYSGIHGCSTFNIPPIHSGAQLVYDTLDTSKTFGTVIWTRFDERATGP